MQAQLDCLLIDGMFPSEYVVVVVNYDLEAISFFLSRHLVQDRRIPVTLLDSDDKSYLVQLPGNEGGPSAVRVHKDLVRTV